MRHEKMNKRFWTWPIAIYLFLGGLGGGTLFMSGILYFFLNIKYSLGFTILLGIVMLALGCLLLIFELGQPKLFVRAFIAKTAIIKWGAVLLTIAMIAAIVWWTYYWPVEWNLFWYSWDWLEPAAIIVAMVASMGLMIYTGVLLSSLKAKPFWNTPILPVIFTVSAMSTGTAMVALCSAGSPIDFWMILTLESSANNVLAGELGLTGDELSMIGSMFASSAEAYLESEVEYTVSFMHMLDTLLVIVELVVLLLFVVMQYSSNEITAKNVARRWLVGETKFTFWGGMIVCGLLIPLVSYLSGLHMLTEYMAPVLVLLGGLLLRFLFVYNNDRREIPGTAAYYDRLPSKDSLILHPYWEKTGKPY